MKTCLTAREYFAPLEKKTQNEHVHTFIALILLDNAALILFNLLNIFIKKNLLNK